MVVGCNIAWGVIDAVLLVLGNLFYRRQRARFFRELRSARSEAAALAAIQEEFGLEEEPLAVPPEDRARLYQSILALSAHGRPAPVGLRRRDIVSAFVVFVLVSAAALPGVIRAHYIDAGSWRAAAIVLFLGVSMVFVAVALGG